MNFENISEKIATKINKITNYESLDYKKMKMGIYISLVNTYRLLIILFLSELLNITYYVIPMLITFITIKFFSGGLHMKTGTSCFIVTNLMYIAPPLLIDKIINIRVVIKDNYIIFIYFIFLILIGIFSPSDTENKPLIHKETRARQKKLSILILVLNFLITYFFVDEYIKIYIIIALTYQVILISPITYKLLGRRYNNYEYYERSNNN